MNRLKIMFFTVILSSCLQKTSERQAITSISQPVKGEKVMTVDQSTYVESYKKTDGKNALRLNEPDLSKIRSWPVPNLSISKIPSARPNIHHIGVSWDTAEVRKTYAKVSLCKDGECITITTIRPMVVFPAYWKKWTRQTVDAFVEICADDDTGRCAPIGKSSVDLREFPLQDDWKDHLVQLAHKEKALKYSLSFIDILREYKNKATGIDSSQLYLSQETLKESVNRGRYNLAFALAHFPSLHANEYMMNLPPEVKEKIRNQQSKLQLTAQAQEKDIRYFYQSDLEELSEEEKEKFAYAMTKPKECGVLEWINENHPLVDKIKEPHNKIVLLKCIGKIPNAEKREEIAAQLALEKKVKSSPTYTTASVMVAVGSIIILVELMAMFYHFRIGVFIAGFLFGDGLTKFLSFFSFWTDSGETIDVGKHTTKLIAGGVLGAALLVTGAVLLQQMNQKMKLVQQKLPKSPANLYFEQEIKLFFTGLESILKPTTQY